jgi:hypothetical protein
MANHLQRIGKTMPYTSQDGVVHAESFWCLEEIPIQIGRQTVGLKFVGYHDTASYDAERQPISGAEKNYLLSGDQFLAAVNTPTAHAAGTPISAEILRMAWEVAVGVKDIVIPPQTPGGAETIISFFESAADVAT